MAQRKQSARSKNRKPAATQGPRVTEEAYSGDKPARGASVEKPIREASRAAASTAEAVQESSREAQEATRQSAEVIQLAAEDVSNRMREAAQLWAELTQETMRQNVEMAQSLIRCRTMGDLLEVQSEWMRRSLDNVMNRGARLSELSAELTLETFSRFGGIAQANAERARRVGDRLAR
jgi:hypothetical protein